MEIIVISIGTLSKNPLWSERLPVRTSHATTTLIRTVDEHAKPLNILVDPSLPAHPLEQRLFERAGIKPADITHIFLTNWRPIHRRALESFSSALWWMHPLEIQAAGDALEAAADNAARHNEPVDKLILHEQSLLKRTLEAPDELAENVGLFPLFGYTPGQCGLIVSEPTRTTIVAGDAVPTAAHFSAGQVFPDSFDLSAAKDSLAELFEIADVIIPGHDNAFIAPRVGGM